MIKVRNAIQQGEYTKAGHASTELIKLAYHLECQKEVFIGEVLEAICLQTGRELKSYHIPNEDLASMKKKMRGYMDKLIDAYTNEQEVHDILMDARYHATVFQFDAIHKYNQTISHLSSKSVT